MIQVHIKHPITGEVRVYEDDAYADVPDEQSPDWRKRPYPLSSALFQYTEHNYSCDCNRKLFFERANHPDDGDYQCSTSNAAAYKVQIWCDGKMIHDEFGGAVDT